MPLLVLPAKIGSKTMFPDPLLITYSQVQKLPARVLVALGCISLARLYNESRIKKQDWKEAMAWEHIG